MQVATPQDRRTPETFDGGLAYGALSGVMKDNLYWLGSSGFIFTSPWVVTPKTVRHAAVVLLTASGEPVEVTAGDTVVKRDAVAIAPLTPRGLRATDVGLVSIHVFPPHPCLRALPNGSAPGVLALHPARLAEVDPAITPAFASRLPPR